MLAHVRFDLVSVTGFSQAWFVQNGYIYTVKCLKTQDFLRATGGKIARGIPSYRVMGEGARVYFEYCLDLQPTWGARLTAMEISASNIDTLFQRLF